MARASEQERPDVAARRCAWFKAQPDLDPERLVFIDEAGASTRKARLRVRAKRGMRCRSPIPHGHWKTTTFTDALRRTEMTIPMVLDGPMTGDGSPPMPSRSSPRRFDRATWSFSATCLHTKASLPAKPSKRRVRGCFSSRPTAPTSTRSSTPSLSSRQSSARRRQGPSQTCGMSSVTRFCASPQTNVPTTSPQQDMNRNDQILL